MSGFAKKHDRPFDVVDPRIDVDFINAYVEMSKATKRECLRINGMLAKRLLSFAQDGTELRATLTAVNGQKIPAGKDFDSIASLSEETLYQILARQSQLPVLQKEALRGQANRFFPRFEQSWFLALEDELLDFVENPLWLARIASHAK